MKVTWAIVETKDRGAPRAHRDSPHYPASFSWPLLGLLKLMCELGNVVINQIYEARVEAMAVKKPGPSCSR